MRDVRHPTPPLSVAVPTLAVWFLIRPGLAALGALTVAGVAAAAMLWPASDPDVVAHAHADP
jgi:hypothetical protein